MKTAIEWLYDKWSNCKEWKWEEIEQWFEQAKEMEKNSYICSKCKSQINGNEVVQQMQGSEKSD